MDRDLADELKDIRIMFLREEVIKGYIKRTGWDKIKSFDDIIPPTERENITTVKNLKNENNCPLVERLGTYFHFCNNGVLEEDKVLTPHSQLYLNYLSAFEQNQYCRASRHKECVFYKEYQAKYGTLLKLRGMKAAADKLAQTEH